MTGVKITAKDVKKLREMTGAGMMDCKKALVAAEGDFEAAIEHLRKKGQKVAAKRADRNATEGAAIAKTTADYTKGIALVLSCETDFVAKNEAFVGFANEIADLALNSDATTVEELLALSLDGTVLSDRIATEIGKIGEKIEISKFEAVTATSVVPYIHAGNRIGVLVALNQESTDAIVNAAKDVAMQVAAMYPIAVDESGIPEATKAKEMEIAREKALAEGKPEKIIDRIAQGSLKKFMKDNTLVNQKFVKDSNVTVKQFLNSVAKGLAVTDFKRLAIG